jgi:hypothetical protein
MLPSIALVSLVLLGESGPTTIEKRTSACEYVNIRIDLGAREVPFKTDTRTAALRNEAIRSLYNSNVEIMGQTPFGRRKPSSINIGYAARQTKLALQIAQDSLRLPHEAREFLQNYQICQGR